MSPLIKFYRLSKKFVNERKDIPDNARQVVYYTLAVGHHVGVLDCFTCMLEIPQDDFVKFLHSLPESSGRLKLEGLLKWGEIEINSSHSADLLPLFEKASPEQTRWASILSDCLVTMKQEPAFYLMARRTL